MIHTTHGAMTLADLDEVRADYDLDLAEREARAEEEAMEAAHVEHADNCPACQEEATTRETGARVALAMDDARRELERAIQKALKIMPLAYSGPTRQALEEGLKASRAALSRI